MEEMFFKAAQTGRVEDVKEILRKNPKLNVNWKNLRMWSTAALSIACENGHDSIVSILLAHPDIDVNLKDDEGWAPFNSACYHGKTSSEGFRGDGQ